MVKHFNKKMLDNYMPPDYAPDNTFVHESDVFSPHAGQINPQKQGFEGLPRIVSLVPSITELLFDMGLGPCVVGRTGFCIHPADQVANVAKVGGTKDVNLEKIRRLAPSHVIVNVDENPLPVVQALRAFVPRVVVTHPMCPQDNLALVEQLEKDLFTNKLIAAYDVLTLTSAIKSQIIKELARCKEHANAAQPAKVLYLIWRAPWMTVARDTYISRMLALIGWQTWPDVLGGDGLVAPGASRYPVVQGDEPWLAQVDKVLLSSEPYQFAQQHLADVQTWLPHAQVQLVDGEMLSWYGSRAIRGLAYLRGLR